MKPLIYTLLLFSLIYLSSCQKNSVEPTVRHTIGTQTAVTGSVDLNQGADSSFNNITGSMRLQLTKDSINNDNIYIGFDPTAKTTYNGMEDAPSFQGFGAVNLASYSSDNVPLAINYLPLEQQGLAIGLRVNATADGIYKLDMLTVESVPAALNIWLIDKYKNDSLNFRQNSSYAFNIVKADTASFGSHRFKLIIK